MYAGRFRCTPGDSGAREAIPVHAGADGEARVDHDQLRLSGIVIQRYECRAHVAGAGLATLIAAALVTGSKNLFSSTTVALMAYILALLVAVANGVAARIEDDETDWRRR